MRLFKRSTIDAPRRRRAERMTSFDPEEGADVFRRGRTLTGSASSHVRTPSEAVADLKSPRVHRHALTKYRSQHVAGLALVLLTNARL